jgi:hypothetical protein
MSLPRRLASGRRAPALLAAGVLAVVATLASPAAARIRCDGAFQLIPGFGPHATPYCENTYLAAIARSYGFKVSDEAMRDSPRLKHEVCMQIGHDARLIGICDNDRPDSSDDRAF